MRRNSEKEWPNGDKCKKRVRKLIISERMWAGTVDSKNKDKKTVVFIRIRKNWGIHNISRDGTFDFAITGISWQRSPLTWSSTININRWGKEQPCYWMLQPGGGWTGVHGEKGGR